MTRTLDIETEFRESDWVDAMTAAAFLGKSRPQLTHYVNSGQITALRRYGRLFVSRKELEVFVPPRLGPAPRDQKRAVSTNE